VISGKLRAARAKAMKFRDGYMVKSGDAVNHYIDFAVRHIQLKQGVLGIKVKIQLPHDPTGKNGVAVLPPDVVTILDPKEELPVTQPKLQPVAVEQVQQAPQAEVQQQA
jgi:small subunit ribosomal protein S3e